MYRARDTELARDVALTTLPESMLADRDRRDRFEREARTLATLNHPNIGAIYGIERLDGRRVLVLELVEGDTLADRIAALGAGLPMDDALSVARQIAGALEAAHEKGIVHRDLKPANIKITTDGTVKVLDFGLAKSSTPPASGLSQSPTLAGAATREGALLGTCGYMSPEQVRGQPIDRRTDVWAFGCVLYEMLTGRVAFPGDTLPEYIAAMLEREPDWAALPNSTPAEVLKLMRRCLERDPRRRLHDIADARIEIEDAERGGDLRSHDAIRLASTRSDRRWLARVLTAGAAFGWASSRRLRPDRHRRRPPRRFGSRWRSPRHSTFQTLPACSACHPTADRSRSSQASFTARGS
ncbi:MAG TPA: serine/threonine-protein kinase [Vicinamibacterales bacterium]|nr:serine/threonine-protein kinase [Vicinamibacterales bacterium]